jgi:hypothetical protein
MGNLTFLIVLNEEENCPELIMNFCDERLKIEMLQLKLVLLTHSD